MPLLVPRLACIAGLVINARALSNAWTPRILEISTVPITKQIIASGLWHGVQQLLGPGVWAVIELVQGLLEQRPVGVQSHLGKQGETGPKLEIIGRAENF
jgi:hypothetical protein